MYRQKMVFQKINVICCVYLSLTFFILIESCTNNNLQSVYKSNKQEHGIYQKVSMYDLLTKPEEYADKLIEIKGVYKYALEESALYSNSNSVSSSEMSKAIWISFDVGYSLYKNNAEMDLLDSYEEFEKINGRIIKVRGRFYPDSKGHLSSYFGALGNVVYLEVLN